VSGRNAFNNAATGADNLFCRARNVDSGVARALAIQPIYIHARRISAFLVLRPLVPGVRALAGKRFSFGAGALSG